MSQELKGGSKSKTNSPTYQFPQFIRGIQIAARSTSAEITVNHARPYGRFIEIKSNLKRKKLHRTNQGYNFLGRPCNRYIKISSNLWRKKPYRTNQDPDLLGEIICKTEKVRPPIQLRRERQFQHLKR